MDLSFNKKKALIAAVLILSILILNLAYAISENDFESSNSPVISGQGDKNNQPGSEEQNPISRILSDNDFKEYSSWFNWLNDTKVFLGLLAAIVLGLIGKIIVAKSTKFNSWIGFGIGAGIGLFLGISGKLNVFGGSIISFAQSVICNKPYFGGGTFGIISSLPTLLADLAALFIANFLVVFFSRRTWEFSGKTESGEKFKEELRFGQWYTWLGRWGGVKFNGEIYNGRYMSLWIFLSIVYLILFGLSGGKLGLLLTIPKLVFWPMCWLNDTFFWLKGILTGVTISALLVFFSMDNRTEFLNLLGERIKNATDYYISRGIGLFFKGGKNVVKEEKKKIGGTKDGGFGG